MTTVLLGPLLRLCRNCQQDGQPERMIHCFGCKEWFHPQCLGPEEKIFSGNWKCGACLASSELPVSESTTIAPNTVPTTASITGAGDIVGSILSEQAKADLQWIAEQRESILREVERQQMELVQRKEKMERLSFEAAKLLLSNSQQAVGSSSAQQSAESGANSTGDWLQKIMEEIRNIPINTPKQTACETQPKSSTPVSTSAVNLGTLLPNAGTFTVLNQPAVPSTGFRHDPGTTSSVSQNQLPIPANGSSFSLPLLNADYGRNTLPSWTSSANEPASAIPPQQQQPPPQQQGQPQFGQLQQPQQGGTQPQQSWPQPQQGWPQPQQGWPQPQQGWPQAQPQPQPQQGWPQPQLQPQQGWPQPQPQPQQGWPQPQQSWPQQGWPQPPQGWPQPHQDLSQQGQSLTGQGLPQPRNSAQNPPFGPTPQQLLARQIMPKELPKFHGNPEDWPLFLSAFTNSTDACGYSNVENMARLQHALQGRALEQVKGRLLYPTLVPQVMSTLYMLYGRPELIIQTLLDKVRETPSPKPEKLETLITFGMAVQNLCDHIIAAGHVAHLCNPVLLRELVEKLPAQQRLNWALFKQQYPVVDLSTFAAYMTRLVEAASEVTVITDPKQPRMGRIERGERSYINVHATNDSPTRDEHPKEENPKKEIVEVTCLACNATNHKVKNCGTFQKWEPDLRWKLVQDNHLCRTCLGRHGRRPCNLRTRCGVNGCQERHHGLLHRETSTNQTPPQEGQSNDGETKSTGDGFNAHHATRKSTMFRILPVTLTWNERSVDTFAFLDDGSDLTLVEQTIAEHLGINDGEPAPLCLSWTSNVTRQEPNSQRVRLEISGQGKRERYTLNETRTVASLDLPKQTMQFPDLVRKFPYLRGLPVKSYEAAAPGILIGSNNASLIATLNLREGDLGYPLASKTRLGWTIYGSSTDKERTTNFTLHVCQCQDDPKADQELHELVKRNFTVESIGVSADKSPESDEDKRARRILVETTRRVADRFETGLLWRYDETRFPDSFPMAMRRLECFERKMKKDPELQQSVQRQIKEYLESNYIHEVTPQEIEDVDPQKVWYLPLGAVRNPKKPGKIRLIWDASAKVGNVSLNSMLLKGPDLLTPLAAVLCGFRERPIAVCGDLRQMFHQFRIRKEDVHSQRFLYRENLSEPVKMFAMDVGSFGATCSPCQAQFIKNLNAKEYEKEFPEAAKAVTNKHYVDDYLDSFDTEAEAIKVALDVKELHSRGGFEIRNWHSNSDAVLQRVGEPLRVSAKAISIDSESEAERVLGLLWLPEEDLLAFATELQLDGIPPTKRNILRCVMSLFDSQGLLSHITVQGRMIIQDTWRSKIKWDEEVIATIRTRWLRWTQLFKKVGEIKLHRAYFPGFSAAEIGPVELHVFTDASEEAYACSAYFRVVINGKVYVTLAMAKAKVAPLKALSVPRLELMGALLGARLAKAVMEYHSFPICRRIFWTDSKTTLAWIQSEHRRYRQFVAFRVGEILTKTDAIDWRYVPTLLNPADEATKWGKGPSTDVKSRWFCGPEFLYLPETEWPEQALTELETDEELRPCMVHREYQSEDIFEITRFSRWELLQRATAYVHRFVDNCIRKKQQKPLAMGCLKGEELRKAENSLWRMVQQSAYPDELIALKQEEGQPKKSIEKTSPIYKLTPYMDEEGVMRVDSRIGAVPYVTFDFKYPIILPRRHYLTKLVVDWYHRRYLHANHRTVHNEVRQRFHVPSLYTVVLQVAKDCQICKNNKANPVTPRMAPLPDSRLAAGTRPFSYVGLDYFGPIQVRVGRSCVKRWVALFTCLTVRAVHLEVVHSLSTESCKMAVRRFVARRGSPVEIHSDNGTNFQGASRELKDEIGKIGQNLAETFTDSYTKWLFIPPSAPHFGGSWERLVRSVKVALRGLCSDRNPDDETLLTVLAEAEAIVNSRPLTKIPLENPNQEALTPNHFLLLSSSGVKQPPKTLTQPLKVTRTNWNMARQLVDQFWRRWISEYLPTISKRTRWFGETEALAVDDLVLVVNEGQRNGWTRGRVLTVTPGRDGRIRQATVQTAAGVLRRPVSKLAVLKVQSSCNAERQAEPERRYGSGDVDGSNSTDGTAAFAGPSSSSKHIYTTGEGERSLRRSSRLASVNAKKDDE